MPLNALTSHELTTINVPVHDARFYARLLDEIDEGVYFVDRERRITFWSRGAERISGYRAADVVGSCCADGILRHVDDRGTCLCTQGCPLLRSMDSASACSADVYLHHRDGHRVPVNVRASPVHDRYGRVIGCVETFRDNSARQADLERIRELEEVAYIDTLTGITNRRHLDQALHARLAEAERRHVAFGILMIDIDHFKRFNDSYGHEVGDRVLQVVARTLSRNCRPYDTVGRWGGEEFLIVAPNAGRDQLERLAERLRTLVSHSSVEQDGTHSLRVTISIGATMFQADDDLDSLLKRADSLLYQSKETGRNKTTVDR